MLRMRKITDQAFVVMSWFASLDNGTVATARAVAEATSLPGPTVAKLLKTLARGELLVSTRGLCGGYALSRGPEHIQLTDVITACEGPLALTECSAPGGKPCVDHGDCSMAPHWKVINQAVGFFMHLSHSRSPIL